MVIHMPINEEDGTPYHEACKHIIACGSVALKTEDPDELKALKELVQLQLDEM